VAFVNSIFKGETLLALFLILLALLLISLSLLFYFTPITFDLLRSILWRGLVGSLLGSLAGLVVLFFFIHSYLIALVVPYFIVSALWGIIVAVLISAISGSRKLEIEFNTDNRATIGALLGVLFGGGLAAYYLPL
jgi:hypothetical protein